MSDEKERCRDLLPLLEKELSPNEWEWSPIGDNTLAMWNWAKKLELDHGINHQVALRIAKDEFFPNSAPRQ
jgi:hypothetical protein